MKNKILKISLFIGTILFVFADQIEENRKRITQIDSQVNKNNSEISKNKNEISKAKKSENATAAQVKELDRNITKLQNEYNAAEKKYRELLRQIGINDANISSNISEINRSTQIIDVNKEDLHNKIRTWDRIRRNNEMSKQTGTSSSSSQMKMAHDLKIVLNKQKEYIQGVEDVKKGAEGKKAKEESIRANNRAEATKVSAARTELEASNKKLNAAKAEKNKLIAQLREKQATLNTENKKIERTNSQLAAEKKKLNAQIQAIIQRAIRERELAIQRAEAERRQKEEAARKQSEERRAKNELSGEKNVPKTSTSNTTASNNTSSSKPKTVVIPGGSGSSSSSKSTSSTSRNTTTSTASNIPRGTGTLSMPINGSIVVRYGQETSGGLKSNGIEIRGSAGQSVKAADGGVVIYAGSLSNLGGVVIIDHGSLVTVYGNLASVGVSKGARVTKGQSIGTLGRNQTTKQPNLYFETRRGVNIINPMGVL